MHCYLLIGFNFLWKLYEVLSNKSQVIYSNANSPASGGCHPHFKAFTRLLKQFPFRPHFWLTKHSRVWHIKPHLPKHSIDKDKTSTFWLDNLPGAILQTFYEFFIICYLWNNKSNEKQVWKIFNIARDYSVIPSLLLAHKNIMQGDAI